MNEKSKYSKHKEHSLSFEAKIPVHIFEEKQITKNIQQFRSWKNMFKCTMLFYSTLKNTFKFISFLVL